MEAPNVKALQKQLLPLLFSVLTAVAVLTAGTASIQAAELSTVTAVYVFGDSTVDVGNNNFFPGNKSKANFPHYGVDFPGGVPTGRFSNGYNGADYLSQLLGYKESPPAVLSLNSTAQSKRGVSFASGGSGILDITGQNVSLSLNMQIKLFENITMDLTKSLGSNEAKHFLSKAIFIFSVGNNDIFGYFAQFGLTNSTTKEHFVNLLMITFKVQLEKLYSLGARKFAFIGTSTLGCAPFIRAQNPTGGCIEDLNDLSRRYNNATASLLKMLSAGLEGMNYSLTNSYRVLTNILSNPLHFGYKELRSACCGGGNFNAQIGCNPNATFCGNRRQYVFWDSVHPTQTTYRLVAVHAYRGSNLYTVPMNIQKLAKL